MTFEEFLIKKKIDPVQLKNAEQDFFNEFKSHFNEMGEKSFDHSKKFWFNKLRRANPLAEEIKIPPAEAQEVPSKVSEPPSEALEQVAEALQTKPTFKPRFKANIPINVEVKNKDEKSTEITESEAAKSTDIVKTTFKPRFKPSPKTADELQDKELGIDTQKEIIEPKPAYSPRFKAGIVKKDEKGG